MNKDPYEVLKVSRNASDEEIKSAYREMSRKYHPDANINNPLADLAEEKFKEVQEAYDCIMKERQSGAQSYSYGYQGGYQSYSGQSQGDTGQNGSGASGSSFDQEAGLRQDVQRMISERRYRDALNALSRIRNRNAEWYYLSAAANMGYGNNILAHDHAVQAVNMEPQNPVYRQLLNQLEWNRQRYQSQSPYGGSQGQNNSCGTGNFCCDLWIADSLCECMGGDLCPCM